MGGFLSRCLVSFGVLGLVGIGCADKSSIPPRGDAQTGSSRQAIFTSEQVHTGLDLPSKTLALTFDDGPSYTGAGGQTRAISGYLKTKGIKATFFLIGDCFHATSLPPSAGCDTPPDDADATIRQVLADGHNIGNHTTTHRNMKNLASAKGNASVVTDVLETDTDLAAYKDLIPWNQWFFRAPQGDWSDSLSTSLDANAKLKKYVGPIYWGPGGNTDQPNAAADWDCWQDKNFTTRQCGDRYLAEIASLDEGIVLMHDQEYGTNTSRPANPKDTDYDAKPGNTYLMLHYVLDKLAAKNEGWSYTTLDQVPSIKAVMAKCDVSCATCNGPATTDCLSCGASKYLSSGACTACSTCGTGTFQASACTANANTVCTSCTTCGAGTFQASACSATANTVCTTCATCPAGQHQTAACTATANTVCANDDGTPIPDAGPTTPAGDGGSNPDPVTKADSGTGPSATTDAGGTAGGCATAPSSSSLWTLGLAGLALLVQRRRRSRSARV